MAAAYIAALHQAMEASPEAFGVRLPDPAKLEQDFRDPEVETFGCVNARGEVVAAIAVEAIEEAGDRYAYVHDWFRLRDATSPRTGRELFTEVLGWALLNGLSTIVLEVLPSNEWALQFYRRLGFVASPGYEPERDEIQLRLSGADNIWAAMSQLRGESTRLT